MASQSPSRAREWAALKLAAPPGTRMDWRNCHPASARWKRWTGPSTDGSSPVRTDLTANQEPEAATLRPNPLSGWGGVSVVLSASMEASPAGGMHCAGQDAMTMRVGSDLPRADPTDLVTQHVGGEDALWPGGDQEGKPGQDPLPERAQSGSNRGTEAVGPLPWTLCRRISRAIQRTRCHCRDHPGSDASLRTRVSSSMTGSAVSAIGSA